MSKPLLAVVVLCSLVACENARSPTSIVAPAPTAVPLNIAGTWSAASNCLLDTPNGPITFAQSANRFSGALSGRWTFTGTVGTYSVQGTLTYPEGCASPFTGFATSNDVEIRIGAVPFFGPCQIVCDDVPTVSFTR